MRRVVVTGYGIVSSIGNNRDEVTASLKAGKSGLAHCAEYEELGFRSQVVGSIDLDYTELLDRKHLRFLSDGGAYAVLAMQEAIAHAGLEPSDISNERTGLIAGAGGMVSKPIEDVINTVRDRGVRRVKPFYVPRAMCSHVSANLATIFEIKGMSYSIGSACATSSHCMGNAYEQIQLSNQDVVFAGGGEELHWPASVMFDSMGALSSKYNDTPEKASRAYDADRDGFVISAGGGMVVLEELEHAKARGATIYAEMTGYAATSDGADMVAPSGEGATRCMKMAARNVDGLDYINTHGTSTPAGDITELHAIGRAFGDELPKISSTKSLTGHAIGAAGVNEAIYCLIMLDQNMIVGSANIDNLDPKATDYPIVQETENDAVVNTVLSNSFGFGGTNASLVFSRFAS